MFDTKGRYIVKLNGDPNTKNENVLGLEASSIGLAPGQFPNAVLVEFAPGYATGFYFPRPVYRNELGDIEYVSYRGDTRDLHIFND